MKFPIAGLILLLLSGGKAHSQSVALEFIGHSDKAAVLNVSPDGKWLLSWDGVTRNTPSTNPGDRKVWNLATKKWRDISKWGEKSRINDNPCGWMPNNKIWQLHTNPQPLGDGNAPYIAEFYLENPDGSGKIYLSDPNKKVWFDDQSYFDDVVTHHFSSDGKQLFVLTESYFRTFDAKSGKMLFRRRLKPAERGEADLSPDGRIILTVTGKQESEGVGPTKTLRSGIWQLREARSGCITKTLKSPKAASQPRLMGGNLLAYRRNSHSVFARLSDGKTLWQRGNDKYRGGELMTKLWVWNNVSGQDRVFAAPEQEQWVDLAISPDRKTMVGVNPSGDIYRFAAHEIKP